MSQRSKIIFDNKKYETLRQYALVDDIDTYIRPVRNKETGEIHNYVINIDDKKISMNSKKIMLLM